MEQPIYLFLDTNMLLQYQRFDMIAWPKLVDDHPVCLVIAPIVLRELDHQKDNPRDARLNERARAVLPTLKTLIRAGYGSNQPVTVRDNVTLTTDAPEPVAAAEWQEMRLDEGLPDDRLLASLISFKGQHQDARHILVTHDFGPEVKANKLGIETLDPAGFPDVIPLLPSGSEQDRELQRLRTENLQLKNQIARVDFGFHTRSGEGPEKFIVMPNAPQAPEPPEGYVRTKEDLQGFLDREQSVRQAILVEAHALHVPTEDMKKYIREFNQYLSAVEESYLDAQSRSFGIRLATKYAVVNAGTIPLTDLRIIIEFPANTVLLRPEDIDCPRDDELKLPKRPIASWKVKTTRPASASFLADLVSPMWAYGPSAGLINLPRNEGFFYFQNTRSAINLEYRKLQPGDKKISERLLAFVLPGDGGISVQYEIYGDQLQKPVSGTLNINLAPPVENIIDIDTDE